MIVYGKQIFIYILEKYPKLIKNIYLAKEIDKKLFAKIGKLNQKIIKLDFKKAQAMSRGGNHQGFLLEIEPYKFSDFDTLKKQNFLLVLQGITDVGNIGAIIRTAYSLGVDGIIISGVKNLKIDAVARSSAGALFDMSIAITNNELDMINELKQIGFTIYGADKSGYDIRTTDINYKKALFMGSEGEGLSNKLLKKMDKLLSIKMEREFESLNVSVATAILCDRMR